MAREVKWTEAAWSDLQEIAHYIAKDSPYYAATMVRELRDAARSLTVMSTRGRKVPELQDAMIRELFVHSYRLIYAATPTVVYILGVIHGARDLRRAWK